MLEKSQENKPTHTESLVFYKSIYAEFPALLLFVVLTCLGIYLTLKYPGSVQIINIAQIGDKLLRIGIPGFGLLPFLSFTYLIHITYDNKYIIGPTYVRSISGILSLHKKDLRIEFKDIRSINIERNLYERIVNVGDLQIRSVTGTEESKVVFFGINDPSFYRDLLIGRIHELTGERPE